MKYTTEENFVLHALGTHLPKLLLINFDYYNLIISLRERQPKTEWSPYDSENLSNKPFLRIQFIVSPTRKIHNRMNIVTELRVR